MLRTRMLCCEKFLRITSNAIHFRDSQEIQHKTFPEPYFALRAQLCYFTKEMGDGQQDRHHLVQVEFR